MAEVEQDSKHVVSLPSRLVVDFMEGVTKRSEAVAFARGFIENHFSSLPVCKWYVSKYPDGYVFEAHEGGHGRAYLPKVLEILERHYDASVCILLAKRVLVVKRTYEGHFISILLPEGIDPTGDKIVYIEPGPRLKSYQSDGSIVFFFGAISMILSLVSFLIVMGFFALDIFVPQVPTVHEKSVDLPLTQWDRVQQGSDYKTYVHTLKFENGNWNVEQKERVLEDSP